MSQIHLPEITFRQIEIFLAVAKYENFTLAANELYMTQASVSRNIQNLEESLGLILFIRHRKHASLTKAGESLAADLILVCRQMEKALDTAFLCQQNQFNKLTIGAFSVIPAEIYLLPISEAFEKKYPNIILSIQLESMPVLRDNLCTGKYDAAYIISVYEQDILIDGLCAESLCQLPPCVVMSSKHPLFSKKEIFLEDIQKQQLVAMRKGMYHGYWEFTQQVCQELGVPVSNVKFVDNSFTLAMELRRNQCIAIMDPMFTMIEKSELRYIPFLNCHTKSGITLVYPKSNDNPYLQKYIGICKDMIHELVHSRYDSHF